MQLIEKLLNGLSEVWPAVNHAPMAFSLLGIAIFLLGFAIACLYLYLDLEMIRIEKTDPNQTSVSSTSGATRSPTRHAST